MLRSTCSTVHSLGSPFSSTLWEGEEGGGVGDDREGGDGAGGGGGVLVGLPDPSVFTRFSVRSRASAWKFMISTTSIA